MYQFNNQRNLQHLRQMNHWFLRKLESNNQELRNWESQAQKLVAETAAIKRMMEINSIILMEAQQQASQPTYQVIPQGLNMNPTMVAPPVLPLQNRIQLYPVVAATTPRCEFCGNNHETTTCRRYDVEEKRALLKIKCICRRCLKVHPGIPPARCVPYTPCEHCQGRHETSLCLRVEAQITVD